MAEICIPLGEKYWLTGKLFGSRAGLITDYTNRFPPMPHQPQTNLLPSAEVIDVDFNERNQEKLGLAIPSQTSIQQRVQTVICLHGWLDNAASYDILAPSLVECWGNKSRVDLLVLTLDFVGHGLSVHRPLRADYWFPAYIKDLYDCLTVLTWTRNLFIIGHSMGGAVANVFASTFPEVVDKVVLIENLGPFSFLPSQIVAHLRKNLLDSNMLKSKAMPAYETIQQAAHARQRGTAKGTLSEQGAMALTVRGIVDNATRSYGPWQRAKDATGWTWRTDQRLVTISPINLTEAQVLAILKRVKCPVFLVLGNRGYGFDQSDRDFPWMETSKRFEAYKKIDKKVYEGGHHLHLDTQTAKQIAHDVCDFYLNVGQTLGKL